MRSQDKRKNLMAPRPVHPTAMRHHGFFGYTFLKQHNVVDEKWTMGDIIDEFHGMTNLLSKRVVFKRLEKKAYRRKLYQSARNLRTQCKNGRTILQNILHGSHVRAIRNLLINSKGLQRLYQRMPVNLVMENINQRTFVMRKERDRLTHRLEQLKHDYKLKLVERSNIENRIRYQNEFVLEEDIKSHKFMEKMEKSKIRLRAFSTINSTYKKVKQVLRHDEVFYEPILRGLSKDIDDQANFIKYILHLGTPAIEQFKKLSEDYRLLEDKSRRGTHKKIQTVATFRNITPKTQTKSKTADLVVNINKRYARETRSMLKLKNQLENVENTIKQIKMATLCSKAKEIFPRFQSQFESNFKLTKEINIGQMHHDFVSFKGNLAAEKENILLHNFSEEEERRLLRIQYLEDQIKAQDQFEEETVAFLKNRADVSVILRYSLWNLMDILRNVGRPAKVYHMKYPNSYLKLPLLKFEMQTMRACPPELFEGDTKEMLTAIENKVRILTKAYNRLSKMKSVEEAVNVTNALWQEYHDNFLTAQAAEEQQKGLVEEVLQPPDEEDLFEDSKTLQNIPNRKQIKLLSAKIVEELSKKDE